jgi:hypothetical protein
MGQASSGTSAGGGSRGGALSENQGVKDGPLQLIPGVRAGDSRTASAPRDVEGAAPRIPEATWFTKLPAEVRAAIRAQVRRAAPRGYEERLERYFQSIDY